MALLLSWLFSVYPPQADKSMGNIEDFGGFNYIFIGRVTTVCHTSLKKRNWMFCGAGPTTNLWGCA
jgi:hypothetical protein